MASLLISLLFAAVVVIDPAPGPPAAADLSSEGVALLEQWNAGVSNHVAGDFDEAVERVAAFTRNDRVLLDPPMRVFLSVLSGRRYEADTDLQQRVYRLALASRQRFGWAPFLRRAAILHTDVAFSGELDPARIVPALPATGPASSPLLDTRRMTVSRDGELVGVLESDWNWPFARSLIELLRLASPADRFVGDWYHATAAYMFSRRMAAEAVTHLEAAARILPDDARILFDRAAYAEIQSLPVNQVLLRGADLLAIRKFRQGTRLPSRVSDATRAAASLDIPMKTDAEIDAERLFRRALKADPALAEARVRLARVLSERGRHEEALSELGTALGNATSGAVAFYAHMFGGRAARALGKLDAAAAHFREATRLFPEAQSALLAQSQLALIRGEAAGTLAPIERLPRDPSPELLDRDPWTFYGLASGRDWDALYKLAIERQ